MAVDTQTHHVLPNAIYVTFASETDHKGHFEIRRGRWNVGGTKFDESGQPIF